MILNQYLISSEMKPNIDIKRLEETSFTESEYHQLLQEFNGNRTVYKIEQYEWYQKHGKYLVAVAIVNGKLVGQATGYACNVSCKGVKIPISWGCDTFVLPQYRGLGLGKKLQKYLHNNTQNFSSAGYTPLNGIIKRKCGAKELFTNDFLYYPVTNLFNFALKKLGKKWLNKDLKIPSCSFPLYYYLNRKKIKRFTVCIEEYKDISEEILAFIETTLHSQYDFYVIRDKEYMQWKYVENPSMTFKMLTIRKNDVLCGVIFFTDVASCALSGINLRHCKLLDSILVKDCGFTQKDALLCVMQYWTSRNIRVDGIASMFNVPYLGKVGFKRPMLSTLQNVNIHSPYMAYSDQDLEQMH